MSDIVMPLSPGSSFYITRTADEEVIQTLQRMIYVQLSEPRQQGKTSLIYHISDWFSKNTAHCTVAYINLELLNRHDEVSWYASLRKQVTQQLKGCLEDSSLPIPFDAQSWFTFLSQLILSLARSESGLQPQIIIALDGIEHTPTQWATSFFLVLRTAYIQRSIEHEFQRLSFILSGTFNPDNLIKEKAISPFNIARRINLLDFDEEQVRTLAERTLHLSTRKLNVIAKRITYWTDGHPYLTQQLISYLEQEPRITSTSVDRATDLLVQEDTSHLPRITRLFAEPAIKEYVEKTITEPIRFAPRTVPQQFQLVYEYGLLKSDERGLCRIRNRIYEMASQMGPIWQEWKNHITTMLKHEGEVTQKRSAIPEFVWASVSKQYVQENVSRKDPLPVVIKSNNDLVLQPGAPWVKKLHKAFEQARDTLRRTGALDRDGSLIAIIELLTEVVGLKSTGSWWSRGTLLATTLRGNAFHGMGGIPDSIPLIFLPAFTISRDTPDALAALAADTGYGQHLAFIIPISTTSEEEEMNDVKRLTTILSQSPNDFVILSYETLFKVCTDADSYASIRRYVAHHIAPRMVSPFITQGPVQTGMFFGRVDEVRTLLLGLPSRSFAIIGNRRIGKSSLLKYIMQQHLARTSQYLVEFSSYQVDRTTPEQEREKIGRLEKEARGRSIVRLIDEPDELLIYDAQQRYQISAVWRELSEAGRCRFIFAGHRILRKCMSDVRSPFFNFAEPLPLGFLDYAHACNLFTKPLEYLGFQFDNEQAMLDLVWRVSAGHPNIIQVIGKTLMGKLSRGTMIIPFEYLEQVLETREFKKTYRDIMWGGEIASDDFGVAPLERLILLLGEPEGFTREAIENELVLHNVQVNTRQIRNALEFLIDFNLLAQDKKKYICKVEYFRSMIREEDIDYLLAEYAKGIDV